METEDAVMAAPSSNTMPITPRERVALTFVRQPVDRVPRFETYWQDTLKAWEKQGLQGGQEAALNLLGADLAAVNDWDHVWPSPYRERKVLEVKGNVMTVRDEWGGTNRFFTDRQTTPEHLGWECDSPDTWRKTHRPFFERDVPVDADRLRQLQSTGTRAERWRFIMAVEPFECLRKLIGDEEMLMAVIEEPEWIAEMAAAVTDRGLKMLERIYATVEPVEGLWIYGDMAFNHSTMCSPEHYRELIWPQHRRLCDWAHNRGLSVIYHTDGNVEGVLSDYVEAGIDMLQPLECKAGMDLAKLQQSHGDQLCFFGNIDVMTLITNNLEKIETEIRSKLAAGMARKNYIYHSDHSIPPQVTLATYEAMIEMVERYGNY